MNKYGYTPGDEHKYKDLINLLRFNAGDLMGLHLGAFLPAIELLGSED